MILFGDAASQICTKSENYLSLSSRPFRRDDIFSGELSEWLKEPASKTGVRQRTGGSNPSLTAKRKQKSAIEQARCAFLLTLCKARRRRAGIAQAATGRAAESQVREGCAVAIPPQAEMSEGLWPDEIPQVIEGCATSPTKNLEFATLFRKTGQFGNKPFKKPLLFRKTATFRNKLMAPT